MSMSGISGTNGPSLSILSPYLFPAGTRKVTNVGDGIILRAVERQMGSFPPNLTFSSRSAPTAEQQQAMTGTAATILAGANQLDDHFTPWPGLTVDRFRQSSHVFVPMGVGLHGDEHRNRQMSDDTRQILDIMHQRTRHSSWRCPRTLAYLLKEMPDLEDQALMTGCPVLYDTPLLESARFIKEDGVIAVTVTERDDFWLRETATINSVTCRFPAARKILVIHQDYLARKKLGFVDRLLGARRQSAYGLRQLAMARGFEVFVPASNDAAIAFYRTVTLHVGSRLHAHLHMLSQNKWSFLTKVDERATGIAEHFGFPLCDPGRFADYLDFDFETVRQAALRTFPVMQRFVGSVGR